MPWQVVGLEITADDLIDVSLSDGRTGLELMGFAKIDGPVATLSGCHVQGPGPNTLGVLVLRQVAQ
jgi:hypothetical protein